MNEETKSVLNALKQKYEEMLKIYASKEMSSKIEVAANYGLRANTIEHVVRDLNALLQGKALKDYYGNPIQLKAKSVKPKTTKITKRK